MLTAANLITLFRISLVPLFVASFLYIDRLRFGPWFAFLIFTVAAVLDAVDGLVARAFNQKSQLGAFLDPLADKLLMTMVYILGTKYGIPLYVTILVVSRDLLIVLGWASLFYFERDTEIRPMMVSKFNTTCQFVTAILILFNIALSESGGLPQGILNAALIVTTLTTVVSGIACFGEWYNRMGGFTRA